MTCTLPKPTTSVTTHIISLVHSEQLFVFRAALDTSQLGKDCLEQ